MEYISTKEAAKLLRGALKRHFPKTKFSVRFESYSMGSHITVRWTDGPTKEQVAKVANPYSGDRFDGMIDMRYDVQSWLCPDGSVVCAGTHGTVGSMGSVPERHIEPPCEGARLVDFGGSTPSLDREISDSFQGACDRAWEVLDGSERVKLWNRLPQWAQDRPDRGLSYIVAAP